MLTDASGTSAKPGPTRKKARGLLARGALLLQAKGEAMPDWLLFLLIDTDRMLADARFPYALRFDLMRDLERAMK